MKHHGYLEDPNLIGGLTFDERYWSPVKKDANECYVGVVTPHLKLGICLVSAKIGLLPNLAGSLNGISHNNNHRALSMLENIVN